MIKLKSCSYWQSHATASPGLPGSLRTTSSHTKTAQSRPQKPHDRRLTLPWLLEHFFRSCVETCSYPFELCPLPHHKSQEPLSMPCRCCSFSSSSPSSPSSSSYLLDVGKIFYVVVVLSHDPNVSLFSTLQPLSDLDLPGILI